MVVASLVWESTFFRSWHIIASDKAHITAKEEVKRDNGHGRYSVRRVWRSQTPRRAWWHYTMCRNYRSRCFRSEETRRHADNTLVYPSAVPATARHPAGAAPRYARQHRGSLPVLRVRVRPRAMAVSSLRPPCRINTHIPTPPASLSRRVPSLRARRGKRSRGPGASRAGQPQTDPPSYHI